eukprot:TRINITY_DN5997_c0_g1_i2.p1 TRINITY_DN5997_c0_g1~~TRINITY_DN5997_c0_g1_i2.p1  ORF type:complete len:121 (-),score=38.86 TRINITY_DN5997_c0_g1_i2:204-566(-)
MNSDRDQLISGRRWGADPSNTQLLAQQEDIIAEQDKHIEVINDSVVRQKDIAIRIGEEADDQNRLLDDIDDRVDTNIAGVKKVTKKVQRVEIKAKNKGLCGVMCFLIIILVVVVILAIKF